MKHQLEDAKPSPTGGKRARTKHSCDQCRTKKAKCDGNDPCQACITNKAQCTYTELKKRGLQPGYIQKLQKTTDNVLSLLGLLASTTDNGEDLIKQLVQRVSTESDYRRTQLANSITPYLSDIIGDVPRQNGKSQKRKGSNFPPEDKNEASPDMEPRFFGFSSGFDRPTDLRGRHMDHKISDFDDCRKFIEPLSAMDLLDVYFAYGHPLFPMVSKSRVVQSAMSEEDYGNSGRRCLLWTILIYALNHTELGKQYRDTDTVQMMLRLTVCCFKSRHSAETVQALLLQALFLWGKGFWSNSWLIVGDAVRMAIDIGLHIYSPESPAMTRRTWKCCCMIDTLISGRLGRNPLVTSDDYFDDPEPIDGEEWDIWKPSVDPSELVSSPYANQSPVGNNSPQIAWVSEPGRTLSIFNQFHDINRIANRFLAWANRSSKMEEAEMVQRLRITAQELKAWRDNLPPHCDLESIMNADVKSNVQMLPHLVSLYFGYVSICHLIHIMDTGFNAVDLVPSYGEVLALTRKLMQSYFSRETTRKALPTFEYFLCLSITVNIKMFVEMQSHTQSLADSELFNQFLKYLEYCSDVWGGAKVSHDYFANVKSSEMAMTIAPEPNVGMTKSKNYIPYLVSSLQEFTGFPNLDSIQPAILGNGRSCIGAMIESLERGDVPAPPF
uniref:ARAD1D18414p n=1 Tax=Blastobotrys adeninivorans TaxID=409370 RepID=A0A060T9X9_BLAAD